MGNICSPSSHLCIGEEGRRIGKERKKERKKEI
jgi:hypothetical protein